MYPERVALSLDININAAALDRYMTAPDGPVMGYMVRLGNQVSNLSAVNCPVDTGYLRSTREVIIDPAAGKVTVAYRANYAIFVHDGTRYMPARPFLADAMRQVVGAS